MRRYRTAYIDFGRAARQHELVLRALRSGDSELVARIVRRLTTRFLRQDLADFDKLRQISENEAAPSGDAITSLRLFIDSQTGVRP